MNRLARLIATALLAAVALVAMPSASNAADGFDPVTGDCLNDAEVRALQIDLIEAEHEAHNLRVTLEEERDEHADELRYRDRLAWDAVQAHNAEVNTYSALAHDAQDALHDAQVEAQATIAQRDKRIILLREKVQQLRDRLRSR